MALTDPVSEWPTEYQAGTTLKVKRSYSDFPAPTWDLKVVLQGRVKFEKLAVDDGAAHLFSIAPADTDTELPAGVYQYIEIATNGTDKYAGAEYGLGEGAITVQASFEGAASGSLQLAIEKELEAVEARIAERLAAGGDMEEFGIGDRSARLVELDKLYARRNLLKAELRRVAAGGEFSRQVLMQFTGIGLRH
jgi:hypothetical protein